MPRTLSRLRKARIRQEGVQIVNDPKSAKRTESAKHNRGHDERGRYGKSTGDPESEDGYRDKD